MPETVNAQHQVDSLAREHIGALARLIAGVDAGRLSNDELHRVAYAVYLDGWRPFSLRAREELAVANDER